MAISSLPRLSFVFLIVLIQCALSAPLPDRKGLLGLLLDLLTKKNDNVCVCTTERSLAVSEKKKSHRYQCTAINNFLPGKVAFPINPNYTASQITFWSAQEQSLHPSCIVIPTSTQDVSTAVTILNVGYQASIPGCKFAVRGAG